MIELPQKIRDAANLLKVSSVQVWGPSGSKYASFVKVKYHGKKQQKRITKKVNSIIGRLNPRMSQAEKAALIHDMINEGCIYDWDSYLSGRLAPNSGNAYGCLVNGKCVCAGYAEAFELVALKAGLKCVYVSSGIHAWNLVEIGSRWYNIDLCWDDTGGDNRKWFLKGSNTVSSDRFHKAKEWYPFKAKASRTDYVYQTPRLTIAGISR